MPHKSGACLEHVNVLEKQLYDLIVLGNALREVQINVEKAKPGVVVVVHVYIGGVSLFLQFGQQTARSFVSQKKGDI